MPIGKGSASARSKGSGDCISLASKNFSSSITVPRINHEHPQAGKRYPSFSTLRASLADRANVV